MTYSCFLMNLQYNPRNDSFADTLLCVIAETKAKVSAKAAEIANTWCQSGAAVGLPLLQDFVVENNLTLAETIMFRHRISEAASVLAKTTDAPGLTDRERAKLLGFRFIDDDSNRWQWISGGVEQRPVRMSDTGFATRDDAVHAACETWRAENPIPPAAEVNAAGRTRRPGLR